MPRFHPLPPQDCGGRSSHRRSRHATQPLRGRPVQSGSDSRRRTVLPRSSPSPLRKEAPGCYQATGGRKTPTSRCTSRQSQEVRLRGEGERAGRTGKRDHVRSAATVTPDETRPARARKRSPRPLAGEPRRDVCAGAGGLLFTPPIGVRANEERLDTPRFLAKTRFKDDDQVVAEVGGREPIEERYSENSERTDHQPFIPCSRAGADSGS